MLCVRCWLGWISGLFFLASCARKPPAPRARREPPRLLVQITVDQLRADLLPRLLPRLGAGGLRRFLEKGVDYRSASYAHAVTETAVGHATLFTGALPSGHGIVGNDFFDPAKGETRAAVSDPELSIVTSQGARPGGVSPRALFASTLGDELALATRGKGLVYAVSTKDRGAIFPGGRLGKAFWLDDKAAGMVSSSYYMSSLPSWVSAFNAAHGETYFSSLRWELAPQRSVYTPGLRDDLPSERPPPGFTRSFPHALAAVDAELRMAAFRRTPFADTLTLDFVRALLAHEPLGQDAVPDLLSISFSATDYIAHAFGPESLELEDQLLRLDQVVTDLWDVLSARVPAEQLLLVLSADHGGCESPEYLLARGLPAGRHQVPELLDRLRAALTEAYGPGPELLAGFVNPYLWLDERALVQRGLELSSVQDKLASLVLTLPGFARAYPAHALRAGRVGDDPIAQRAQASFYPGRSGHVHVVPQLGWLLANDGEKLASMHGTPHRYDRDVQLSFYGWGLPAQSVYTPVDPRDIAVTLAAVLEVKAPSAASGRPLESIVTHIDAATTRASRAP